MRRFYKLVIYKNDGRILRTYFASYKEYGAVLRKCRNLKHKAKIFYVVDGDIIRCAYSNYSDVEE